MDWAWFDLKTALFGGGLYTLAVTGLLVWAMRRVGP